MEIKSIIRLNDDKEYVINNKVNYEEKDYIYLEDINDNTNLKFAKIKEDNSVSILDHKLDIDLIGKLIPMFYNQRH